MKNVYKKKDRVGNRYGKLTVIEVSVSQTFFGWVFQFGGDIQILAPRQVLEQYREMLEKAHE